jgi:hypothetical protein
MTALARALAPVVLLVGLVGCGGGATAPSQTTTSIPASTIFALSGGVLDNKNNANKVSNAALSITDGANAGRSTTTDGAGNYRFTALTPGTFTISLTGAGYISTTQSVTLGNADKVQNLFMDPVPLPIFTRSGTGANVLNIPTTVTRIRIQATYPGSCENFIVHINGRGVVNEILGTCSVASGRTFDGTFVTTGGLAEVLFSTNISWTFTEVR